MTVRVPGQGGVGQPGRDELVEAHPLANAFIVPGANPVSAFIDLARATIRRAERRVVELRESDAVVNEDASRYLNRLSDALFVMSRHAARLYGESEPLWEPEKT